MMYYVYCIRICIFLYLWGSAKSICHCGKQNPRQGLFGAPMFWCRTRRYCRLVFAGPNLLCPSHGHRYLVSRHALFKRIRKICSCSVRQHLLLHPSRIHSAGKAEIDESLLSPSCIARIKHDGGVPNKACRTKPVENLTRHRRNSMSVSKSKRPAA